jgi:hypothetical protein
MKRLLSYLMLFSAITLGGCEAVEDRLDIGGFVSAEQLDITATPVVVNGKNTNKVVLNNASPVLSSWDFGVGTTQKKTDTVLMVVAGENEILFTGRNPDGSEITKTLTVNVEDMHFPVPPEWGFLTGGTEKEWVWNDTRGGVWGNGGYISNSAPAWWVLPESDISGQSPGEGVGAKMIFSLRGAKFTKVKADGTTESGTFSFNMNSKTLNKAGEVWAKGKLTLKGTTVLNGISPNEAGAKVYEYDILVVNDNEMALAYAKTGAKEGEDEAWFWMFRAAN